MNNMRIPTRRAPTVEDARRGLNNKNDAVKKKVPPPRPPPPNFGLAKSKSAWSLTQPDNTISLIEWSPPNSPKIDSRYNSNSHSVFNGSVSSSFSSSTSSLASSKKSYEYECASDWLQVSNSTFYQTPAQGTNQKAVGGNTATSTNANTRIGLGPTIIRAAPPKKKVLRPTASASASREVSPLPPYFQTGILTPTSIGATSLSPEKAFDKECGGESLPMPNIPPPSPPKDVKDVVVPFGIALYDYNTGQQGDLQFTTNDVIYLTKKINNDWLSGRTVDDREGMFPSNFIDIQVPLSQAVQEETSTVQALYDFDTNIVGDLRFRAGDSIKVRRVIDNNWLEGECNGRRGQFPANFVNRIPKF